MNKDPFSLFIEDSAYYSKNEYYKLMYETKRVFFDYLNKNKTLTEFKKETAKIWEKVDHKYMAERIKELEDMIMARDLDGNKILNPDAEYKQIYELASEKVFQNVEKKYKYNIDEYYKGRRKTANKSYIDRESYLSKLVTKYDEIQATIPYHNKDGSVRSWHNIADYNSMLYNTNLNHAGWNRTIYDANLLEKDLLYLPAHTFACPLCMPYQGKVYSKNGKSGYTSDGVRYYPQEEAIAGGVGHPNCRHQWTIYWDKDQIQENDYNSDKWQEDYEKKQKIQALQLKRTKLKNDKKIYENLGNGSEVDKTNAKIKVLNAKISDIAKGTNKIEIAKEKEKLKKQMQKEKLKKEKEIKRELQKQSSKTHKEMQELFKIRENRPKYIEELNRKQDKLKEVRKIIRKNKKDNAYYMAKQEELSLKVDIKNLKELINK